MTRVATFSFDDGRVAIFGGPAGWTVCRVLRSTPLPIVDIVALDGQSVVIDLVERAIRGDRHAAERLLTIEA